MPLILGVMSISWGSTRGFKVKFCSMVAMSKNISMRARPSPRHIRFPRSENSKQQPSKSEFCLPDTVTAVR